MSALTKEELTELTALINARLLEFGELMFAEATPGVVRLVYGVFEEWREGQDAETIEAYANARRQAYERGRADAQAEARRIGWDKIVDMAAGRDARPKTPNGMPDDPAELALAWPTMPDLEGRDVFAQHPVAGLDSSELHVDLDEPSQASARLVIGKEAATEPTKPPANPRPSRFNSYGMTPKGRSFVITGKRELTEEELAEAGVMWDVIHDRALAAGKFGDKETSEPPAADAPQICDEKSTDLPAEDTQQTAVYRTLLDPAADLHTFSGALDCALPSELIAAFEDCPFDRRGHLRDRRVQAKLAALGYRDLLRSEPPAREEAAPPKTDEKLTTPPAAPQKDAQKHSAPDAARINRPRTLAEVDGDDEEEGAAANGDDEERAKIDALRMGADEKAALLREVITELNVMAVDGKMPSMTDWERNKPAGMPTHKTIFNRHGLTWNELARYAKLTPNTRRAAGEKTTA